MKFLCDNCRAKYQIPDEKIAGRTLRMKCRKCTHDIIIRGQRQSRRPSTSPGRRPSRRPSSALGAEFRRAVGGSAPNPMPKKSSPPSNRPKAQWHVSVNDVPIGPIRREEVARKIGMGAVTGASLVWREGFDDWRPLSKVSELSNLLEQRRVPAPPTSKPSIAPPRAPRPPSPRIAPAPRRSNVIPIGGRLGGAAAEPAVAAGAAAFEEDRTELSQLNLPIADVSEPSLPIAEPETSGLSDISSPLMAPAGQDPAMGAAAVAQPQVVEAEPEPKRKIPLFLVFFAIAVMAFSGVLAVLVFNKMLSEPAPIIADSGSSEEEPATEMQFDEGDLEEQETYEAEDPSKLVEKAATAGTTGTKKHRNTKKPPKNSSTGTSKAAEGEQLTAEEKAMLDRMGQGGASGFSNIRTSGTQAGSKGSEPLKGKDVAKVVSKNKKSLQRCYDRAIRGQGNPPSVRMNVNIKVAASGRVTSAKATPQSGSDFGGLKRCIESSVKRWGFPRSTMGGETKFPVVFSGS